MSAVHTKNEHPLFSVPSVCGAFSKSFLFLTAGESDETFKKPFRGNKAEFINFSDAVRALPNVSLKLPVLTQTLTFFQ